MRSIFRASLAISFLTILFLTTRSVHAVGPTTKIILDPTSTSITADQSQTFKVLAVAADGTSTDVTDQSTLSTNDPSGGVSNATYNAGKVGAWAVQAAYQSFTATATVTVTPGAIKEIVVNPNSDPEQLYIGTNWKFSATAYDAKNNEVTGKIISWSVIGEQGSIDKNGKFIPSKIGTGKVQAAIGEVLGVVSVVVNATPIINTNRVATILKNTNVTKKTNTIITNTTTNIPVTSTTKDSKDCTTLKPWVWTLILILFLLGVSILFALIPVTQIWPSIVALGIAGVLAFIQRKYACNGQAWWAWVMTLGTIALTAVALQMRPKNPPTV